MVIAAVIRQAAKAIAIAGSLKAASSLARAYLGT